MVRDALSTAGYHTLEMVDRQDAETTLREVSGRVDLILTCVHSDTEAREVETWRCQHGSVPLLTLCTSEENGGALSKTEVTLRVRLALEAAQPSRSIVVVDGNALDRKRIVGLLKAAGYCVKEAASARAALALFRQSTPDLLLTGVFMEEMDGLELIQQVRKSYPETGIIAMSADGYLSVARILGARGVLGKPISVDSLLQTVREVAECPRPTRATRAKDQRGEDGIDSPQCQ